MSAARVRDEAEADAGDAGQAGYHPGRLRAFADFIAQSAPESLRPMVEQAVASFMQHRDNEEV